MLSDPKAAEAAIGWLIRQQDPAFADWEAFTAWLEADPANAEAYDRISVAEASVADRLSSERIMGGAASGGTTEVGTPVLPASPSRRGFFAAAAALAASILAVIGTYQITAGQDLYTVATAAGERRTVALAGGSTIALNGGTRLTLDREDVRFASLESGEAVFDIVHDDAHPFTVEVAGATLVDLGTRFSVLREAGATEVAVAEGLVLFNPGAEAIRLQPGRKLRARDGETTIELTDIEVQAVGSWREGVLIYRDAPLDQVARDLTRNLGLNVAADPAVAARPVTGIVQLPGERDQLARRLEKLFNIKIRRSESDWTFTPSS